MLLRRLLRGGHEIEGREPEGRGSRPPGGRLGYPTGPDRTTGVPLPPRFLSSPPGGNLKNMPRVCSFFCRVLPGVFDLYPTNTWNQTYSILLSSCRF